jgi:putative ABC transport system permease protein
MNGKDGTMLPILGRLSNAYDLPDSRRWLRGVRAILVLLRRVSRPYWMRHRVRLALTSLAIVVSVAAVLALHLVATAVVQGAKDAIAETRGRAELAVVNGAVGVPESLLGQVRHVAGADAVVPVIERGTTAVRPKAGYLRVMGIDLGDDQTVRTYEFSRRPASIDDPVEMLARPYSIIVTKDFADRHGLATEGTVDLLTPDGVHPFRIAGVLEMTGPAQAFGGNLLVMDIFAAQKIFGQQGRFDRLDVVVAGDRDPASVQAALAAELAGSAAVVPSVARNAAIEVEVKGISLAMHAASTIGLAVALFLIYNTLSVSVSQRRHQLGTLRALGLTDSTLQRYLLAEAALIAAPACVLGLPLGFLEARAMLPVIAGAINENIGDLGVVVARVSLGAEVLAAGCALVVALLGAVAPARAAVRLSVTQRLSREREVAPPSADRWSVSCGIAVIAIAVAIALAPRGFEGGALLVSPLLAGGVVLCLPSLFRSGAPLFRTLLEAVSPAVGKLAGESFIAAPKRAASTAASVMLATAAVIAMQILLGGLRTSAEQWGYGFFPLDLMVTAGSPMFGVQATPIPHRLVSRLASLDGVQALNPLRIVDGVRSEAGEVRLVAQDFRLWSRRGGTETLYEGTPESALATLAAGAVLVSQTFAARTGIHPGQRVRLGTPKGPREFPVGGVFGAGFLGFPGGTVAMDIATYRRHWRDRSVTTANLFVRQGVDPEHVAEQIRRRYSAAHSLFILSKVEFRRLGLDRVTRPYMVAHALEVVAALLAAFGVLNTLLSSVLDRRRDLGVLRALGATTKQVTRTILLEAALLGAIGATAGVILGAVSSYALLRVFDGFGWQVPYSLPPAALLIVLGTVATILLGGGWYPAWSAGRLPVVDCLRAE